MSGTTPRPARASWTPAGDPVGAGYAEIMASIEARPELLPTLPPDFLLHLAAQALYRGGRSTAARMLDRAQEQASALAADLARTQARIDRLRAAIPRDSPSTVAPS
ncbi:hypothetical protein MASR2M32_00530 [Sphaerotilus sulfidivorans]